MDNAKRQDNLTVFMWLVCANKLVGNRPDKVSLFLYIDSGTLLSFPCTHISFTNITNLVKFANFTNLFNLTNITKVTNSVILPPLL